MKKYTVNFILFMVCLLGTAAWISIIHDEGFTLYNTIPGSLSLLGTFATYYKLQKSLK